MFVSVLVKYWFLLLTIIVLVAPVTISIFEFLPGMILMWLIFFIYKLGITGRGAISKDSEFVNLTDLHRDTSILSFSLGVIFLVYIPFYVSFYTGNTFNDILDTLLGNNTNYRNYQMYFESNNLSELSVKKMPYIISFALIKLGASLSILKILVFQEKRKKIDYITLLFIIFSFLYSSIGRGTSFELFELFTMIVFAFLLKIRIKIGSLTLPRRNIFQIVGVSLILIIYFIINIANRFNVAESIIESDFSFINCATNEFCVDNKSLIYKISPVFAVTLFQLANYFTFGIFFSSKLITGVFLKSIEGFLSFVIPSGAFLFFGKSYTNIVCELLIDCGHDWIPDIVMLMMYLGGMGTVLFLYYLGVVSGKFFIKAVNGSLFSSLLLYYIIVFVISLPSGNFITASSSNQLCILVSVIMYNYSIEQKILYLNPFRQ